MTKKMNELREERQASSLRREKRRAKPFPIPKTAPKKRKRMLCAIEKISAERKPPPPLPDRHEIEDLIGSVKGIQACYIKVEGNKITDIYMVIPVFNPPRRKSYIRKVRSAILAKFGYDVYKWKTNFSIAQIDNLKERLAKTAYKT